ncbi:hypothetical protein GGP72_003127 [Salinibacter ruber]|uniref:Uncharacterized protein n=1 Tax=Salinibacter ruber TaxID=146919 RepID=A0A9X2THX5_9BACT|nr:hypothetical protein [Salinibacter ruber]MCS3682465.1 hypothetical protein [Salinibacter ruber]
MESYRYADTFGVWSFPSCAVLYPNPLDLNLTGSLLRPHH